MKLHAPGKLALLSWLLAAFTGLYSVFLVDGKTEDQYVASHGFMMLFVILFIFLCVLEMLVRIDKSE